MRKYMDILSDLESKIGGGQYRPGQKLPSIREAAKSYGCSTSTIVRAYAELEKRHAIYSMPQSGYYVVGMADEPAGGEDNPTIDFTSASPDAGVFPYLDFQHCLNKAIDTYKHQLFTYGNSQGLDKLRQTLAAHLADGQVFAKAERLVVTSGAQQALDILAKMPFPNGKAAILVEQPGYDIYLRFLEKERIPVYGIARTAEGIDLQELEKWFKRGEIKFFYTMPRYHNPLGTTYNAETRKSIASLADKYGVYVVEDDYMADLGEERGFDPIYTYSRTDRVVYVKSFSKIVFPGLRLGVAVLPEQLLEAFRHYKSNADTSLLSQAALEVYIKNGMYERNKRRMSSQYAERMRALNEALQRHNEAGRIRVPAVRSGVYLPLMLPRVVNLERLLKRLAARRVLAVSGKRFYLADSLEKEKFVRLSVSRTRPEQIEEGVRTIMEEIGRELRELY